MFLKLLCRFCGMIWVECIIVQVTVEILWDDFGGMHHCSSYCGDSVEWFRWIASLFKLLWRFCGMISVECIIVQVTVEILWDDFGGMHHCSSYCEDSVGWFQWKAWVLILLRIIPVEDKNWWPLEISCDDSVGRSKYCGCNGKWKYVWNFQLASRSRKRGSIHPFPHMSSWCSA
jgi:hypothetical protein